ncbi:MAG TPA: hypothetical protein VET48_10725, partial [Steroidobacteraceae bacterium]|nr:hypothetical protein [Steroidobacteraceae bacterium]
MTPNAQSLITELDTTLSKASRSKHLTILRSVTDLFFNGAQNFSKDHIAVFDDVIDRLVDKTERPVLIELSTRLA